MRWRLPLYIIGFSFAVLLDIETPLGPAVWLIEVVLAWVATAFGGIREMIVVAVIASASMMGTLWSAPEFGVPSVETETMEIVNRLAAAAFIWLVVYTARRRRMAEAEVKVLRGLLPICASCKRIRHGKDEWESVESYVTAHSEAMFSHGLCPECFRKYYAQIERRE